MWKWLSFLLLGTSIYLYLSPHESIQYVTETVIKWKEPECPECTQEPCTIDWKEQDKVYVISQDLPCHCGDTVTDQLVNEIHVNSEDDDGYE